MGVAQLPDVDVVDGSKNLLFESTLDVVISVADLDVLEVAITVGTKLGGHGVGR
jgi:hypothetical protein